MTFSQVTDGESIAEGDKNVILNSCRPLPHHLEAEKSILGTILLDNQVIGVALEIVAVYDFYSGPHRII
jgi:hypothetical protein